MGVFLHLNKTFAEWFQEQPEEIQRVIMALNLSEDEALTRFNKYGYTKETHPDRELIERMENLFIETFPYYLWGR